MEQLKERKEQEEAVTDKEKAVPEKEKGADWFLGNIRDAAQFLTGCWMFLMLTVFPLYFGNKYHEIGGYKFSFFSGISALLLIPAAVLGAVVLAGKAVEGETKIWRREISPVDIGVLLYLAASVLSYAFSAFPADAWEGVGGWNMGLHTQLLMGASYFLISRFFPWKKAQEKSRIGLGGKLIFYGFFAGSGITFALGVLHRFGVDPLGMYKGIDSSYQILFLSTIGQATWYSSYVCTVFAIGICIFFAAEDQKIRIFSGLYCVLGFMTLVTQNSDSAFASLALLFIGLFAAACSSPHKMERFLETVILGAASFKAIGFLQWGFADRALELGKLSTFVSRGWLSWLLLLCSSGCLIWLLHWEEKKGEAVMEAEWRKTGKMLRRICLIAVLAAAVLVLVLIAGNTAGLWQKWFGITFRNQYLLFNDKWGSDRGFTWKISAEIYAGLPWLQKLVGVGPDCFQVYSYSIPEFADRLYQYWKPDILTNAHNEFLNLLICTGMAGLFSFLSMFVLGARRFYRAWGQNRCGGEKGKGTWPASLILAGMLCILAYAGHNFFCYQQVCCTPFLFLIMGLAESAARLENRLN